MADDATPAQGSSDPNDLAAEALRAASDAIASLGDLASGASTPSPGPTPPPDNAVPFAMPKFEYASDPQATRAIELLSDVNLNVKIELGRTRMLVEDVLKLSEGAVVELDKLAGDPVDIYVNDRHVARGEVLVLNDNFCVRINEILQHSQEAAAS
ncbi:MAG: flagellar motor switch protein FliN [Phycisphaerales bacterium]